MLRLYEQAYASVRPVAIVIVENNAGTMVFLFEKLRYRMLT